jgi:hypothetical protein
MPSLKKYKPTVFAKYIQEEEKKRLISEEKARKNF